MKGRDIEELLRDAPLGAVPESLDGWAREAMSGSGRNRLERSVWRIPGWVGIAIGALCFAVGWGVGQSGSTERVSSEIREIAPVAVVREVVSGEPFTENRDPNMERFFASTQEFRRP